LSFLAGDRMIRPLLFHGCATRFLRGARRSAARALLAAFCLALAGCAAREPQPPQFTHVDPDKQSNEAFNEKIAAMAATSADLDYKIGPEDLLEVTLFDIENREGNPQRVPVRVSSNGVVALPYVGEVVAAGLTPIELEARLREAYRRYIREPQIAVLVSEYQSYRVSVVGYVKEPKVLELRGRKTLLEAIALTGGLTDVASKSVRLTRSTPAGSTSILVDLDTIAKGEDPTANLVLLPGDVVSVPRAGMFYVEGIVSKPGAYPLLEQTTVSEAIATAGGADRTLANIGGTVLYRKQDDGSREAIPIDLASLQAGGAEDFAIHENDVIVVPVSGPKLFFDRVTSGILRVGFNSSF
jgi:polysaccharide export outer membrane protein